MRTIRTRTIFTAIVAQIFKHYIQLCSVCRVPHLRIICVGGCWDWTPDCYAWHLEIRQDLIQNSARSHPLSCTSTYIIHFRLNLIHYRLDLIHTRQTFGKISSTFIHSRLDLIHNSASNPHSARSHPNSAKFHLYSARSHPQSTRSHPNSARFHPHSARSHLPTLGLISSTFIYRSHPQLVIISKLG